MASHPPSDIHRQNRTADISTSVATIRHIIDASGREHLPQDVQALFSCLSESINHLVPGINDSAIASHKDVYKNRAFLKLLKEIAELGRCAQSDLEKCQQLQQRESKVYGLTGSVIGSNQEQMGTSHDVRVHTEKPLPLEDRWQAFNTSKSSCKDKLQQIENLPLVGLLQEYIKAVSFLKSNRFIPGQVAAFIHNSLTQHQQMEAYVETLRAQIMLEAEDNTLSLLAVCCDHLCDVMNKWRSTDAWIHGGIIAASEDQIDKVLCELDSMFQQYLRVLENVTRLTSQVEDVMTATIRKKTRELENKVCSIGWHMTEKPPYCVLGTEKISLSVRMFAPQMKDITNIDVYIFPESDYNNRHSTKYLQPKQKYSISNKKGALAEFKNLPVDLKKYQRAESRCSATCCEQFYRVSFRSPDRPSVEWLSTPFNVRTGSKQLWECNGADLWYIFTALNLYSPPFKCQREMSISQLLTMLQAMVLTIDPDKVLDDDEIQAFTDMLHTLTNTDSVSLKDFVKHPMKKQGREKSGENSFSCFTWVVAALNTYKDLKDNFHEGDCSVFAGYDQVKQKLSSVPDKCAWIRISRNEIETPSGKTPYAHVVVHVCTASGVRSLVLSHTQLKEQSLASRIKNWVDINQERLVLTVLPHHLPVEELDRSPEEHVKATFNSYRTPGKTETREILLEKFEKMHIGTDVSDADNDCSDEVPAKRARIQPSISSAVSGKQPQVTVTTDNSLLSFSDKDCSSDENYEGLNASITSPLPPGKLLMYSALLPSNNALPENQQLCSQPGTSQLASISAFTQPRTSQLASISDFTQPGTSQLASISDFTQPGTSQLASSSASPQPGTSQLPSVSVIPQTWTHQLASSSAFTQPGTSQLASISDFTQPRTSQLASSSASPQPGTSQLPSISALPQNQQQLWSQPLTPVKYTKEELDRLLETPLDEDSS